jgi:D-beta-D-heptose 7-phosphate kinase/D-beta-D-heptose 1-phosphate adenosyltransferase
MIKDKIISRNKLSIQLKELYDRNVKTGFTNGCFDIIHAGHVRYLERAAEKCDILIVGVNSDSSVRRLKGDSRPVNSQEARLEVLAALESVDYVTMFEEDTPLELIREIMPDMLFKGGDWKPDKIVGGDIVAAHGGEVHSLSFVKGYSTSDTIKTIRSLNIPREKKNKR